MRNPKQFAFETKGYVVVKGLLSREEVNFYRNELQRLSATSTKNSWTFPDGLAQNEAFWPVIKHPNILATIKEILVIEPGSFNTMTFMSALVLLLGTEIALIALLEREAIGKKHLPLTNLPE